MPKCSIGYEQQGSLTWTCYTACYRATGKLEHNSERCDMEDKSDWIRTEVRKCAPSGAVLVRSSLSGTLGTSWKKILGINGSVEIPTRCSFVIEFIIPKFIEGSTCFERHTAHHQEL